MYVRLYYKKIKLLDESARIDVILKKIMSDYDIHVGSLKFEWRRLLKEVAYRYKASVMKGSDEACWWRIMCFMNGTKVRGVKSINPHALPLPTPFLPFALNHFCAKFDPLNNLKPLVSGLKQGTIVNSGGTSESSQPEWAQIGCFTILTCVESGMWIWEQK